MKTDKVAPLASAKIIRNYRLADQIGHILRRASQRHSQIFSARMQAGLTPTRFAALAMLFERGGVSQNELGRLTAMDIATIKGVVDRLRDKGLVSIRNDPHDARRNLIELTPEGQGTLAEAIQAGVKVSAETLAPLNATERQLLVSLLTKISCS